MKSEIRSAAIFGIIIAAAVGAISVFLTTLDAGYDEEANGVLLAGMDKSGYRMAPDLVGISHYLNTDQEALSERIKDKVVLYDIWTYSCINCIRTLPHITAWNEKYADDGLLIIGIHSPEFEFEKDPGNVRMAIDKHGITYPVVMDNEMETWKAFENRYWPRKYIADHEGYIRYDHIGEGAYAETEKVIQRLLEERAASLGLQVAAADTLVDIEEFEHSSFRTPELYFGYKFAQGRNQLGSEEGFNAGQVTSYAGPKSVETHKFYPVGEWRNLQDSMELVSEKGSILLRFNAKEVNIVTANSANLEVFLDGKPLPAEYAGNDISGQNRVKVAEPGLYNIISSDSPSAHMLEIRADSPGFQIFTFTFG